MTQQTEKICFRYDGSEEAKQAHKLWDKIKPPQTNIPMFDCFYYSSGVAYYGESKPSGYRLVSPAEFLRIVNGESQWTPKYGEEVEVSDSGINWMPGYYCCPNPHPESKDKFPHCVMISQMGGGGAYRYIRPIRKSLREEINKIVEDWLLSKNHYDLADRIISLVKERGVEG